MAVAGISPLPVTLQLRVGAGAFFQDPPDALDLPFVFGTLAHPMFRPFAGKGPEARALAERMQDAWIAFARTGRPDHADLPAWPAYDPSSRRTMILDRQCRVESAPREPERAFWDRVPTGGGGQAAE